MTLPPFFYSLKFWEALALVIAALVAYFFPDRALADGVILGFVLAVLRLFGVVPQLRGMGRIK